MACRGLLEDFLDSLLAMSFKRILAASSILESIRDGLKRKQLMDKYGLSRKDLKTVLRRFQEETERRATQIIQDFVSGLQVQDIAARNGFPAERFVEILRLAISHKLGGNSSLAADMKRISPAGIHGERRRYPRISRPVLTGCITDPSCPEGDRTILDISEKGIAVKGIDARVEDEKTLFLGETAFDLSDPIVLTCSCRWTGKAEHPDLAQCAGFEITGISESDGRYLKSLIEAEQRLTCSL